MDQVTTSLRESGERLDVVSPTTVAAPAEVSVGDMMAAAAETMRLERGRMNGLSSFKGDGTFGDKMARAIGDAATAATRTSTGDAGDELEVVGQVLLDSYYGRESRYLGQGFLVASSQFAGRKGLTVADLHILLTGLLEGAQQDNPARPGDGTLLDVLIPALAALNAAVERNLTPGQMVQGMLGAATLGVKQTARMTPPGSSKPNVREDAGAVAAQTMLTGMVKGLLGSRVPETPQGERTDNFILAFLSRGIDLFDLSAAQPQSGVGDTLSQASRAGNYSNQGETSSDD